MPRTSQAGVPGVARRISRRNLGRGLIAGLLSGVLARPAAALGASEARTAATVDPTFDTFYERFGGAAVLGAPLTGRFERQGRTAQLFENVLLEHWAENAGTAYEVQPALLGVMASGQRYFREIPAFRGSDTVVYFPATRHSLRFGFLEFWRAHGGLELFGYPISEEVPEGDLAVQWFQRAKLVFDPARTDPVRFDDIGRQWLTFADDGVAASYAVDPIDPVAPGTTTPVRITVTNLGGSAWPAGGADAVTLGMRWADPFVPAMRPLPDEVALPHDLAPGASATLQLPLVSPSVPGAFRIQPDLRQKGGWLTALGVAAPITPTPVQLEMPEMRVGLLDISNDNPGVEHATITSTGGLEVRDEGGLLLAELEAQASIVIHRDIPNELQVVTLPDGSRVATVGKVLVAPGEDSMLQLAETDPWRTYRGSMEFAWLAKYASAWVVNVLPMEDYLAGIAEQGDGIPWEALRASAITFRSYAYVVRAGRRASDLLFDAAASTRHTPTMFTRHQVYHGMAREFSGTRLREAVEVTRGMVLTYAGEPIMAVYFSRADGRTRSWHETWGGRLKPWALSVPDPYSEGQRLLGHGIGLPLRSANAMAADGASAEQILPAYYSDVEFGFVY